MVEQVDFFKDDAIRAATKFAEAFFKSSTSSIDLFLARNDRYADIGKQAIVHSIWDAERTSRVWEDVKSGQDWYSYLYNRMSETMTGVKSYESFRKNKVAFVTFNYDRSLENFLYESLTNSFAEILLRKMQITKLMPFKILHIYGKIADLPWEDGNGLEYGLEPNYRYMKQMTDNIKIVFQSTKDDITKNAKGEIACAKRVFFLGFGYAQENLQLLDIPEVITDNQEVYGTALGFTDKEIARIRKTLSTNLAIKMGVNPIVEPINSYELLREYL